MEKKKKRIASGDFVTRDNAEGNWMVTGIVFNYELNIHQARILKVGDPKVIDHVEPETLMVIEKNAKWHKPDPQAVRDAMPRVSILKKNAKSLNE